MDKEINIEYTVEEKDFMHFNFSNIFPEKFRILGYIVLGLILFSILFNRILWDLMSGNAFNISSFVPLVFVFLFGFIFYNRVKWRYKKNAVYHQPMKMQLTETDVTFSGEGYHSVIDWNRIHKVREHFNYFTFFTSSRIANIVSKSQLSQEEIDNIRYLLKETPQLDFR